MPLWSAFSKMPLLHHTTVHVENPEAKQQLVIAEIHAFTAKVQVFLLGAIALLLLLIFLSVEGWAQQTSNSQLGASSIYPFFVNCVSGCSSSSGPSFGSAFPSSGVAIGGTNGTDMEPFNLDGSGYLYVDCPGCSGVSPFEDNAAFTAGTTGINVLGAWYSTSATNCTSGHACAPQLTVDRKLFVNAFQATSPWVVSNGGTFPVQGTDNDTIVSPVDGSGYVEVNCKTGCYQTTQPVSGTFWQATQPVSIATMPSTPVTGTFWQATQPVSGTFWQTTQPVSITTMPSTPVTGTFWQATQPVSIATMPSTPVTGTFWQATQPVSGTFWQTTQPVSITTMPSTPVTGTFWQATQPISGTVTANQGSANATPWNDNLAQVAGYSVAADSNGRQIIKNYPDTTTTSYSANVTALASAASATDIAVLPGNATNTVLVYYVEVSCTQTTAGIVQIQLIKRSTADTSGTSSNMTVVPDDSNYASGVSVPKSYTANPTTGTAVGTRRSAWVGCMATGTTSPNDIYIFHPVKPIVLRGTAQQLAVNLNGATVSGGSFDVTYDYAETTTP